MPDETFIVWVHRDDYPYPAVGDRERDEELGPIMVTAVEPDGDGWRISYGAARD